MTMAAVHSLFFRRNVALAALADMEDDQQPLPLQQEQPLEEAESHRRCIKPRIFRLRVNLLGMPEAEVLRIYRFNTADIFFILDLIKDDICGVREVRTTVPPLVRLLCVLQFVATGTFQRVCAMANGISQSAFSKIFAVVLKAILKHSKTFIQFPCTVQALREVKAGLYQVAGFPNVVGCIDGTHIRVVPPSSEEEIYQNQKRTHSINVQMVCDGNLVFTHCYANFPGSAHDDFILNSSSIPRTMETLPQESGWLLGDRTYGLKPWILTPFLRPRNDAEARYNQAHISTRNCIERAFGVLKSRFRCLDNNGGDLLYHPKKVCQIVVMCCILHNIARKHNVELHECETVQQEVEIDMDIPQTTENNNDGGKAVRNHVVQKFFS